MSQPFLDAVFQGARFHGSELPVDVLQELAAYRELLIAVARRLFFTGHPQRKRVPRGFADSLNLSLSGLSDGSTIATLSRQAHAPALPDMEDDVFEPARELIGKAVSAVNSDSPVPDDFPKELLPMFNRLGRRLKEGDYIEFRPEGAASGPRFSVETKRRILRVFQDDIEVAYVGYSQIAGVHMSKGSVTLRLPDGREVPAGASSETLATVTSAVPEYERAWLRVGGTACVDRHDRVTKVTELDDVEVVEEGQAMIFDRVLRRVAELEETQDGWLDGFGAGLDGRNDVAWVRDVLLLIIGELGLQKPGIFLTPEGHVQAEWLDGDRQITIRFDVDERTVRTELFDGACDSERAIDSKRSQGDSIVEFLREHRDGGGV